MGSKIGNDHLIIDDDNEEDNEDDKLDKMTVTVRKLSNGNYEYVGHNIPEEDVFDLNEQQKLAEEQFEIADLIQPQGYDLTKVQVNTKIPFFVERNFKRISSYWSWLAKNSSW